MKTIEVDDDLYLFIASQTRHIGESASDILRRLLVEQLAQQPSVKLGHASSSREVLPASPDVIAPREPEKPFDTKKVARELKELRSSTKRFLALMSYLYRYHQENFAAACEIKGSKRMYFSTSIDTLLASGKTTKPQAIPNSPYFVITNTNTQRKRTILEQLALQMGLDAPTVDALCQLI